MGRGAEEQEKNGGQRRNLWAWVIGVAGVAVLLLVLLVLAMPAVGWGVRIGDFSVRGEMVRPKAPSASGALGDWDARVGVQMPEPGSAPRFRKSVRAGVWRWVIESGGSPQGLRRN